MAEDYRRPTCTSTLREVLASDFHGRPDFMQPSAASSMLGGEMLTAHDSVHIVFGTSTSLDGEMLTDFWTFFGTDFGLHEAVKAAQTDETWALLREHGFWKLAGHTVRALPAMRDALRRSQRMTRKWSFCNWRDHLDRRLCDIRAELGIQLPDAP